MPLSTVVRPEADGDYDKARAYHAGDKFYAEVDIIMDENELLKVTHDVSQTLQRKLEGRSHPLAFHVYRLTFDSRTSKR